jgi:hypothetical protein
MSDMSINIMPLCHSRGETASVLLHISRKNSAPARAPLAALEALAQLEPVRLSPCLRRPLVGRAAEPKLERLAVPVNVGDANDIYIYVWGRWLAV